MGEYTYIYMYIYTSYRKTYESLTLIPGALVVFVHTHNHLNS